MAVTRIKNNQITDSTITYQKIASGTLVGSLFNANLTLNSNVSIAGNLTVTGNTSTINSIDTVVSDSLITLNNGYVGVPAYDVGLLFNRALGSLGNYGGVNAALVWSESDGAFITVLTTETGTTAGTINRAFQANMIVGNLTVSNAVTAQTATITTLNVTNSTFSGLTSTGNIVAASGQNATNYTTGAIVVPGGGGVGITGDLWVQGPSTFAGNIVAGNIQLSGNINVPVGGTYSNTGVFFGNAGGIGALYAGTTTYTALPTTVFQMTGNVNTYAQVNFQNLNSGTKASTDLVLTADNGNDTDGFIDLGINSSTFADPAYPGFYPNDGYLVHHTATGAGNLVIFSHESGSAIKLHVGEYGDSNVRVTVTNTGLRVNTATASTSTESGALLVDGGIGIKGNIHAAAINSTPIGNTNPSTGSFTYLTATTGLSTANAVVTGGYAQNLANITATDSTFTNGLVTTLVATNFSTANAIITGGNINLNTGASYVQASYINSTYGNVEYFVTNSAQISSGNLTANIISSSAIISGGSINNTPIGSTTPAAGNFTNANATTVDTYTVTAANINATNGNITNLTLGNITTYGINVTTANIVTLVATNLSTANAVITGGYVNGLANLTVTTGHATNFSTGNAVITGGYADNFPIGANAASTGAFTSLSAVDGTINGNLSVTSGTDSTSTSTGAITIIGGAGISGNLFIGGNLTVLGNTTTINTESLNVEDLNIVVASNATTGAEANGAGLTVAGANATLTYVNSLDSWQFNKNLYGIDITMVNANITTANLTSVNTPTVNANVITVVTLNASLANITTGNVSTLNTSQGNVTTLVANNFSSANAVVTGGSIDGTAIGAVTPSTAIFTTANATTVNANNAVVTTLNGTNSILSTVVATNFSSGNAVVSGGYISALTNAYITTGNITNFSTGNAVITGGYADNFPIGANTAAPGYFTNLEASNSTKTAILNVTANVYLSPQSAPALVTINPLNVGTIDNMSIGSTSAANVYASNFRAATSVWAATTGPVWIRGGTGISGINNIPIGAVTPSTGAFTTADIATGNITTLNNFTGNITTLVAANFNSSNVVVSGGYVSALTNAYITTSLITNFSTANARITGGYADNFPIGANIAAPGTFTTLSAASLNSTVIGNTTPAAGTFTELSLTGNLTLATSNIVISSGNTTVYTAAAGTANTTGALVITGTGGAAVNGNVYIGQGAVINGNQTGNDTIVRGVNERSLLYIAADSTYDQVSIGGNITTANISQGAKLVVKSSDAMIIPVGTTAQRPGAVGFTDVDGMIRYNTTTGELEYYGDNQWNNTGSTFTVIQSRTFSNSSGDINGNVDGSNVNFTLAGESTTAATLVAINGVIQIPATAYSVTGNVVTFTEAPAIGDIIDTRTITTTSTVIGIASLAGFNEFATDDTKGLVFYTGNVALGKVENWRIDTYGDFYPVTTANLGAPNKRVDYIYASNININGTITGASLSSGSLDDTVIGANIARQGHFTLLYSDSTFTTNAEHVTNDIRGKFVAPSGTDAVYGFSTATYRSGKFFVQLSDSGGGEYQAAEVIAVHNGTTCSIEVYGVTFTGAANLATFSCNIAGGTAYLNASSAGANLAIKVTPTLMKL